MKHYLAAAAIGLAAILPVLPHHSQAAPAAQTQQQKLAALDPEVRKDVKARMAQGETFDHVVEQVILNEVAARYPGAKFYKVVPPAQTVLVAMPDNTVRSVAYDPATLNLEPQADKPETASRNW